MVTPMTYKARFETGAGARVVAEPMTGAGWEATAKSTTAPGSPLRSKAEPGVRRTRRASLRVVGAPKTSDDCAMFLSETIDEFDIGARFLDRLSTDERAQLRLLSRHFVVRQGEAIFRQGDAHQGIFIIESGRVRVFSTAPSGREITLAYWTPGHFIGGPEISGGGTHMWSGVAVSDSEIASIPAATLQQLVVEMPNFALALVEGLVAKGKCYSSMAQMLGTRSVIERLAQYLLNLSELYGSREGDTIVINHKITHDQIAAMVGSTRQWVTMMLKRFQARRIVSVEGSIIRIERIDLLEQILFKE
jgi:CRP-like cAMP-binding protein